MGIYIHGGSMPKERECVVIFSDGKAGKYPAAALYGYDGKDARCAIELPPHGRLGDLDALRRAMYHEAFDTDSPMQKWDSGCWIRYKLFERMEEAAPTIIPAEGGDAE